MYEEYWKLREKPFENTPDPRFIYYSRKHEEALSRMLYAIRERKSAAMLTGECGSGKTLLSRILLEELSGAQYQSVLIFNPRVPPLELLKEIASQLNGDMASLSSMMDVFHYFNEILYRNENDNKKTVIIVDEAQALLDDSFEELRLLLNFQLNDKFLLTIILLGQAELTKRIKNLPQFKERIAVRYNLTALSQADTKKYIRHRLKVAGSEDIFQENTFSEIYKFSGGIPGRINNICDMALLVGYGEGVDRIDERTIREVAKDLDGVHIKNDEEAENVRYSQALENVSSDDEHCGSKGVFEQQVDSNTRSVAKPKSYTGVRYFD
ncbi:MAG: ExeA family protein [Planctomycetota bacterium]|jgi:general secretion pathway protein A